MSKKKKEKITYYDDGSSLYDMSDVGGIGHRSPNQKKAKNGDQPRKRSTAKEKWKTYVSAVRMMLVPTLVALGVILALYILLLLIGQ
ncbi:MAG: hypothetical protein IJX81_00790 [Clostridia bacterium]|nr:hypothetical protein [Clostridia bacterium]